jgi:hypothetical protein
MGRSLIYGYKWGLGHPTSANASHRSPLPGRIFRVKPSITKLCTVYSSYEGNADDPLTWNPARGFWERFCQRAGLYHWDTADRKVVFLSCAFLLRYSPETVACSVESSVPLAAGYNSVPKQFSKDFFSRVDMPLGHSDGYTAFPWDLNITVQSVGNLKHP